MNTLDRILLGVKAAAAAGAGGAVAAGLPKWVALVCVAVNLACLAMVPSRQAAAVDRAIKDVLPK